MYEAPEEGPGFPPRWSDSLRVIPPQELVKWGWTLQEGRLPEVSLVFPTNLVVRKQLRKCMSARKEIEADLLVPLSSGGRRVAVCADAKAAIAEEGQSSPHCKPSVCPEAALTEIFVCLDILNAQKKPKRPRPSEDLANGSGSGGQPHQGQQQDANKRQKQVSCTGPARALWMGRGVLERNADLIFCLRGRQSGGALTPRTPGLAVGTPGGSGRTPGARG